MTAARDERQGSAREESGAESSSGRESEARAEERRAAEFFAALRASFERAARERGVIARSFRIAGRGVELRFAGGALIERVAPALEHLATPAPGAAPAPGTRDLTVSLWDSESTGSEVPPPPWLPAAYAARGDVLGFGTDRLKVAYSLGAGTLSALDLEARSAFYWVRAAAAIPPWEFAAPLRPLLGWWAPTFGGQLVHAAAVGLDGRGLLIAAAGGSGKSTTALACLDAGLLFAGDDYVLVTGGEAPAVHSLFSTAKVEPARLAESFPALAAAAAGTDSLQRLKSILVLGERCRSRLAPSLALRGVLVPRIARRTALRPASPVEALKALAPTTVLQLPGAGPEALAAMAAIVRAVPRHVLERGPDLAEVVAAIRGLLVGKEAHA
jgi:hypothetical protein